MVFEFFADSARREMKEELKRRKDKEYEVEAVFFSMNIYELLFSKVVFVDEIEITSNCVGHDVFLFFFFFF